MNPNNLEIADEGDNYAVVELEDQKYLIERAEVRDESVVYQVVDSDTVCTPGYENSREGPSEIVISKFPDKTEEDIIEEFGLGDAIDILDRSGKVPDTKVRAADIRSEGSLDDQSVDIEQYPAGGDL